MSSLKSLLDKNRQWALSQIQKDPEIFKNQVPKQAPKYLWIGCSDSRLPAHEMLGLHPGDVFVHRNIANVVPHTDMNCLSVLEYGIGNLNIENVIVCGHYGCGGVAASMKKSKGTLVDNWLRHIRDVYFKEKEEIDRIQCSDAKCRRLIELNVLHQVRNVCYTNVIQQAWQRGQSVTVHGWIYDIATGLINDLKSSVNSIQQIDTVYRSFDIH